MLKSGARPTENAILDVRDLSVYFDTTGGELEAVRDVSFAVAPGEMVGVVGESGSGKSVTALAMMALLPSRQSRVTGSVRLAGRDLLGLRPRDLERIRGREISMIFQEPMTALDPVFTVGHQIEETVRTHEKVSRRAARARAIELLDAVGIPDPSHRVRAYPHQLSGGMRQRIMIAIALVSNPGVLIADEPTTALDVTIQAQILELLRVLSQERGTAVLLITHDLAVVAEVCSRLIVMYAGHVVEEAGVDEALERPLHPYTSGLIRSIVWEERPQESLYSIPGRVPSLSAMPDGCRFHPRCEFSEPECISNRQILVREGERRVRCRRHSELLLPGTTP